jgi:hypothetical protein
MLKIQMLDRSEDSMRESNSYRIVNQNPFVSPNPIKKQHFPDQIRLLSTLLSLSHIFSFERFCHDRKSDAISLRMADPKSLESAGRQSIPPPRMRSRSFGPESNESPSLSFVPDIIPPFTQSQSSDPLSPPDPEGLRRFVKKESWQLADRHLTQAIRGTRRELFQQSLAAVGKIQEGFLNGLTDCAARQAALQNGIEQLSAQLQRLRRQGLNGQRASAGIEHVILKLQKRQEKLKWQDTDFNLQRTVRFAGFLKELQRENDGQILPIIDIDAFRNSFPPINPQIRRIERRCVVLRARMKPLAPQAPGTGDLIFDLMHPLTKTGQIIMRYEEKVSLLSYAELASIVQRLTPKNNAAEVERLLFDLAWLRIPFPFGVTSSRVRDKSITMAADLFPAVVADTALDQKWALMPFTILNGAPWPFKTAVDVIWDMLICTSPWEIARAYWRVIGEVSRCMEQMLVAQGQRADDVEVDFDSLFPLLMICVFAFGVDEWIQVATYALSFMEYATADAELSFAMTYLEGLVTQIIALDYNELRRKAENMRVSP